MTAKPLFVIRWYTRTLPKRCYYIQHFDSEGRFFGTVRHFLEEGGRFSNAKGQLTAEELATVVELVKQIRSRTCPSSSTNSAYIGVLADGPIGYAAANLSAAIFRANDENIESPSGVDFTRITEIIERYVDGAF